MDPFGNIEKRIKRHLLGKAKSFYVSTVPGFEQVCLDELSRLGISVEGAQVSRGGIEFSGKIHECYLANLHLRTANRILMRIDSFRATNFRQLGEKVSEIPWELYLHAHDAVEIDVTSHKSRLIHTGAITEQVQESIGQRRLMTTATGDLPSENPVFPQRIFIRAEDDKFTFSLDSSGELLHKRGLKTNVGKAPLRETIAAVILAVSGYDPDKPLLDPMCGAGTFSLEGALIANRIPAGWFREFAFMGWPCFKASRWEYLRREAEKNILPVEKPVIFASDIDPAVCREFEAEVNRHNLSNTISVKRKDFFDLSPSDINVPGNGLQKGLVVINPPYGRRMGTKAFSEKMFDEICRKLKKDFKGWQTALIIPDKKLARKIPFKGSFREINHGGLNLTLMTGTIN